MSIRRRNAYQSYLVTAGLLAAWELAVHFDPSLKTLIAAPSGIIAGLLSEIDRGQYLPACARSVSHVGWGVLVGVTLGICAGIIEAKNLFGAACIRSLDQIARPIPPLACIPFGIILFGTTDTTASFIVAIGVFWTMEIAARESIRAIPFELLELGEAYGYRGGLRTAFALTLPAALPGLFAGFRTAVGQGWTLVVAAELAGVPGIGQRLWEAAGVLANETVFAYMATIALLNRVSDLGLTMIDRRIFRWRF